MDGHERIGRELQEFFDGLWRDGDPWALGISEFEQRRFAHLGRTLEGRRYRRALELGCGAGAFTRVLAEHADEVTALDIAPAAIARARETHGPDLPSVEFRVANIMDDGWEDGGPWDLVVFCETVYYLGWRYSFFDLAWLATRLRAALTSDGRLLLANCSNLRGDKLLMPYLISTYRDLFRNVGFTLEHEDTFVGSTNGVDYELLVSLFTR